MNVRFYVRLALALYIFNVIIPSKAGIETVNQTEAEEICKAFGGLASFEHFNPPPGTSHPQREPNKTVPDYLNQTINHLQIEEGESVWISGRANYSDYLSYHSCRKSFNRNVQQTFIEHNDLFSCWNNCDFTYVGIAGDRCYCLHENMFTSEVCSDGHNISDTHVYLIHHEHYTLKNDKFQCLVASWNISSKTYSTDKCSGKMRGLCKNSFDDKHTLNCAKVSRPSYSFCIFNESLSWVKHRENCVLSGGIFFPYPYNDTINFLEANIPYTLGAFRTFKPVPKQPQSSTFTCLAVTRVGDELWLEPEDCATKRRYLCNNVQYVDYYPKESTSRAYASNIVSTYKSSSFPSEVTKESTVSKQPKIKATEFNHKNITTATTKSANNQDTITTGTTESANTHVHISTVTSESANTHENITIITTDTDTKSIEDRTTIIIVAVSISIAGLIIGALIRYNFVKKSRTTTKCTTRAIFGSQKDPCSTSQELGASNNPIADDGPNKSYENNSMVLRNYEYAEVVDSNITHNECLINETNIGSPETEITTGNDEYSTILLNKNFQESTENVYDHTNSVLPPGSCRVRPCETNMVNTPDHIYDLTSMGGTDDTYNSIVNRGQTIDFSSDYDHINPRDLAHGDFSSDFNHINSIN